MGKKLGDFKFSVGDVIIDEKRNLEILETFYIPKEKHKYGKSYIHNEKWYRYKCLNCGNEDIVIETSLCDQKTGCNACCNPPKKIVKCINDISTTAPWMVKYIIDKDYIYANAKCSKAKTKMICPECGRIFIKSAEQLYANHGLSCVCGDGWSYPNKFIYSFLEQLKLEFYPEKTFDWSNNRIYDEYVIYNDKKIIIEMNGAQHYHKCMHDFSRTVQEEKDNDIFKEKIARENGIDYYFKIDCSISDCKYIKESIMTSGLLDVFECNVDYIDWNECDKFATSNLYKHICEYHNINPFDDIATVANHFHMSVSPIQKAIKAGLKYGWCKVSFSDTKKLRDENHLIDHGEKPIYSVTDDLYFQSASIACNYLSDISDDNFHSRQLRKSIDRNQKYKNHKFVFISRNEFDIAKSEFPDKCFGNFFYIKEKVS